MLTKDLKKSIRQTYEYLINKYLEDCEGTQEFADYGDTSVASSYWFSDYDFKSAKENAHYEIKTNFEDYNNWIFEDDFEDEKDYQAAKQLIIEFVEGL